MNYPGFQQNTNTNTQPSQQPNPTSEEYKILEKLKAKGNEFFKQGKYQEASTQYTEVIFVLFS